MIKLTNWELEQLHVVKRVGVRFTTDKLDLHVETYEIVEVSDSGVVVEKRVAPVVDGLPEG